MRRLSALLLVLVGGTLAWSQQTSKLSAKWEELTGPDFVKAIQQAQGVCVLPFGILEKHGAHLPIGTDLINVRFAVEHAVDQEYAVIFPAYYFGQIAEARQQPGTMAYDRQLQLSLLQATTDEMSRNGCKKIVIVNGHGGNLSLLPYFAQTQLDKPHDYVVYVYWFPHPKDSGGPKVTDKLDMHAGQSETSVTMISRPDLVHQDRAKEESGEDLHRQNLPDGVYTGIWWYARFPNHYSGDGSLATKELGEYDMKAWEDGIANVIRSVKADQTSLELQNQFYRDAQHPLDTKQ